MKQLKIGKTEIELIDKGECWLVHSPETPSKFRTNFWDAVETAVIEEFPDDWSETLIEKLIDNRLQNDIFKKSVALWRATEPFIRHQVMLEEDLHSERADNELHVRVALKIAAALLNSASGDNPKRAQELLMEAREIALGEFAK